MPIDWASVAQDGHARQGAPQPPDCVYGERFQEGCCHEWSVHCWASGEGRVRGADSCEGCPQRRPLTDVHIAAVITAWNEDRDEVWATWQSLRASVRTARLTIILVDDGSTNGCCDLSSTTPPPRNGRFDRRYLRHDEPQGVGRSRNAGWALAVGADVVSFHDAHMRFPAGALEELAVQALRRPAVVNAASCGIPSKGILRGCDLHWGVRDGLQPKWRGESQREAWARVPCMMGAGYVISAATAHRLAAPTGQLWEDTAGRWGFSEQALSVKAFLLGVPVLQSRDVVLAHRYREKNPVPNATAEIWKNVARCAALLFGRHTFDLRFRDFCTARIGKAETERCAEAGFEAAPDAWPAHLDLVWTHLLGAGATCTAPHPDHAWLPEVEKTCRALATAHPAGKGLRILVWRPGEGMLDVRRWLPAAEIHAVERPGHRFRNWRHVCRRLGITLHQAEVGAGYVDFDRDCGGRGADLVLVAGEVQERCMQTARAVLRRGGRILCNPSADRHQVATEFRKEEQERLRALSENAEALCSDAAAAGDAPAATSSHAGASHPDALVTVCLLNWRRPKNIGPVLDSIAGQSVPARVLLWNNGDPLYFGPEQRPIAEHPLIDIAAGSRSNLGCFPRWWLASLATTEFVCSMDDDLALADERVLADLVAACRERCPDGIVGLFGWRAVEGKPYKGGRHMRADRDEDASADVIKGRCMLLRRALLERVPLAPGAAGLLRRCDDIYVSLHVGGGLGHAHLVPGGFAGRWRELPRHGTALECDPEHYAERERAVRAFAHPEGAC